MWGSHEVVPQYDDALTQVRASVILIPVTMQIEICYNVEWNVELNLRRPVPLRA